MAESIAEFVLTDHARFEMARRGIADEVVRQVLGAPEQRFEVRAGRVVLHSRVMIGTPTTMYLVRVVVDVDTACRGRHGLPNNPAGQVVDG